MNCELCNKSSNRGGVINGKYYSSICNECISGQTRLISAQAAEFQRLSDRQEFAKDIIQPYDGDKPNGEFIKAYPNKAKEMFSEQQLREFG